MARSTIGGGGGGRPIQQYKWDFTLIQMGTYIMLSNQVSNTWMVVVVYGEPRFPGLRRGSQGRSGTGQGRGGEIGLEVPRGGRAWRGDQGRISLQ